jgi:hypothetical protein
MRQVRYCQACGNPYGRHSPTYPRLPHGVDHVADRAGRTLYRGKEACYSRPMTEPLLIEDDLFLMANLRPADTGLPMVVWVSERGSTRHDARIKVSQAHGPRIDPSNTATVAIRPSPHLIAGTLSAADLRAVAAWITLNEAALIDYWNSQISTVELIQRLRSISSP